MEFTFKRIVESETFLSVEADSLEEALEKAKTDEVLYGDFEEGGDGSYVTSFSLYACEDDYSLVEEPIELDPCTGEQI